MPQKPYNSLNSNSSVIIDWTPQLLEELEAAFTEALSQNADIFMFRNNGYTMGYAYHLIRYLKGKLAC
jgi:hypothetical protein